MNTDFQPMPFWPVNLREQHGRVQCVGALLCAAGLTGESGGARWRVQRAREKRARVQCGGCNVAV